MRLLGWNLRDIAGFERSHVAQAIAAKAAIPADKLAAIGEICAQIALMWRFLEGNFKANDHPGVIKGVQLAKDGYFGKFQPLAEQMRKVSAEGAAYPMSLPQWVDTTTPQLFTLLEIMYGAGVASEAHTAAQRHAAILSLILSCSLLMLGACAMVISVMMIIHVARPLKAMTEAMQSLAEGNVDVAVPGLNRNDEIGHMAKTVVVFRDAAAEKIRLESQAAEREKKSTAERDAAMAQMANEFEAAVGGIVKAAATGDFTQRVDLRGKSGLVLNIGTALNSLGENTNKVLDDLIRMLNSLSEGNLTERITGSYEGNFAILKDKANMTAECIGTIISDIKASTREVTNASAEISTSTTDLSQRTEEQAASLEETSASMEQMTATVKKNAENAQQANQLAAGTREVADRGGEVVAKAVGAMARIEESSRKICRHHRRDRRDRAADQPARAQCRGRGRARGRGGTWLCGGGDRGAQPRAALIAGREGHQGSDHQQLQRRSRTVSSSSTRPAPRSTRSWNRSRRSPRWCPISPMRASNSRAGSSRSTRR